MSQVTKNKRQKILNKTFGDRLKATVERRGLSAYSLAAAINCHPSTVYDWFSGQEPGAFMLEAAAKHLGVSVDWLLTGRTLSPSTESVSGTSEREQGLQTSLQITLSHLEEIMSADGGGENAVASMVGLFREMLRQLGDIRATVENLIERVGKIEGRLQEAQLRELIRDEMGR